MEVIVDQNHISSFFANVCAVLPHRDTDVGTFQSNAIIDAVASHPNDVSSMLQSLDNRKLVFWCYAIEDADIVNDFLELRLIHLINLVTADRLLVNCIQADQMSCLAKVK